VLEPVLIRAKIGTLFIDDLQCFVKGTNCPVSAFGRCQTDESLITGIADTKPFGSHSGDVNLSSLIHVSTNMEPHGSSGNILACSAGIPTGKHVHAVELGMACDTVNFRHKLGNFDLDVHPVFLGVNTVGRLNRKFPQALKNIFCFLKIRFANLDKGNAV